MGALRGNTARDDNRRPSSLALKRVLITGGARGIGLALAERFAAAGAELVLTDIDADALETAAESLRAGGSRCLAYRLDVTDPENIATVREALHRDAGGIDVLVNNAGIVHGGLFEEVPLDQHLRTYRINVEGTVATTHAFFPDLLRSPAGHCVFIASASGFIGLPGGSTYASSKWATIGFAESIRAELAHRDREDVGVTIVCPSYVDTGLFAGAEPPKTTRMLRPSELAEKVVRAVEKKRVWVMEPWIVKITPLIKHGLPTRVGDIVSSVFGADSSMDRWTGHLETTPEDRDSADSDASEPHESTPTERRENGADA